jgi:TolB-like protein
MVKGKTFSIEEVNEQTQRILDFPTFRNSPTLTKFLEFIVSETIHERDLHLKEYSIAINVLNRRPDFNPHDDAVVRIHAGRLRRALNDYYTSKGKDDRLIIHMPKGSYIPHFDEVGTLDHDKPIVNYLQDRSLNPVVAVFPFRATPQRPDLNEFSLILGEELSAELSRFQDISVIGYYSMEVSAKIEQNTIEAGKLVGADYIITGSLQYYGKCVRIRVNLLMTATGEVMMTKSFEKDVLFPGIFEIQDEIVQSVIGTVGGYYGIIFQEMAKATPIKVANSTSIREGIYNYYNYKRSYTVENYRTALFSLQNAVKDYPQHAVAMAMLGELYLDGIGLGLKTADDALAEGYQCILQSLKIDPLCQHAWHTLTWVHLFRREKEACLHSARQCIQLNPNSSIMVSGVAFMLICAGYFDEGFPIMEEAVRLNPYYPWWINGGFSFYYLYKKEYAAALYWAEKMHSEETFWDPLLKAVSLSYLDKKEDAEKYLSKLLIMEPETPRQIESMLSTFLLSDELIAQIIGGLKRIGCSVALN